MSDVNNVLAKAVLILDQPFFASILLSMPLVADEAMVSPGSGVPTFGTNGKEIRYHPDCFKTFTLPETVFVLAHEVMHCVFQHMHTRGQKNANKWNIAGDYIINDILVKERVGTMPAGGLLDHDIVKRGNGTTEGVYGLLPEETEEKGAGQPGGAMDHVSDAGQDEAGNAQDQAEMKVKLVQAKNAAKMMGKLSAGLERLVADLVKPKADWKNLLRQYMSEKAKTDYSFAKPKRRFLAEGLYLPSLTGESMGKIAVAVDCSGSVDDKTLAEFTAELRAIVEDIRPSSLDVIYFHHNVFNVETYGPDDVIEVKAKETGGTAFSPIFERINAGDEAPVLCIVLTDLCCSDFGPVPNYPVLWASTYEEQAPFGNVIMLK